MKKVINSKMKILKKKHSIYLPLYNYSSEITNFEPEIYNKFGSRMKYFFIRDIHTAHDPYGGTGKYFVWDRYNYGLDIHFYTHQAMLQTMGNPTKKYGMLLESRNIVPRDYRLFDRNKGLERDFEAIFTYDDVVLNEIENAKFFPSCAGVWYGKNKNENIIISDAYQHKEKDISIVSSNKEMCLLHKIRLNIARKCKKENLADAFGTFDGGTYTNVDESLQKYRYSFAIENQISDYFFTERITNCFASQTIPIYLGANKIDKFFNIDGIIKIEMKDVDDIESIIKQCTEQEYVRRLPAILDNYNRVQKYLNMQDYLYENYFLEL